MKRGLFIVFEGLDRSGKSTQLIDLEDHLISIGEKVWCISFPCTNSFIGQYLREYLDCKLNLNDEEAHRLFADNRREYQEVIEDRLNNGVHVLCDRYAYSGVAYSRCLPNMGLQWCMSHDKGMIRPDIVFYMSTPYYVVKQRSLGKTRSEKPYILRQADVTFKDLLDVSYWFVLDGTLPKEDIHERVKDFVSDKLISPRGELKYLW